MQAVKRLVKGGVILGILISVLLLGNGCASLPANPLRTETHTLGPALGGALYEASRSVLEQYDPDDSAFLLLEDNAQALEWRLALIDHAVTSVELQYFIWENDETGRLLLNRLTEAAERGVRVRLLVDDFPVRSSDEELALLARRKNFNLRIFNPTRVRRGLIGPAMEMVIYFKELNRRMHNKLMIVDGHWAIVGGRNIGNAYFGLDEKYNFRDLDILVTGPVIRELEKAFDAYWNSDPAFPGELITGKISRRSKRKLERLQEEKLAQDRKLINKTCYPARPADWYDYFQTLPRRMLPGEASYLQDKPVVSGDRGERLGTMLDGLGVEVDSETYIISPYLIPPASLFDAVKEATDAGVDVTFLTASMGANNHTIAHSHYKKYRTKLLASGAELYEFSHEPNKELMEITDIEPVESKFIAFHIKAIIEDSKRVYLGSLNLDPRAMKINTENMMVIDSHPIATQMVALVEKMLAPGNAWQVYTNENGKLRWRSGEEIRSSQPARTAWQRVSDCFFRLLPVENQL